MHPHTLPRVRCSITFLTADEGGRSAPPGHLAGGTYRPHLVLDDVVVPTDLDHLGVAFVAGPSGFPPGRSVDAEVVCLYAQDVDYSGLTVGSRFRVFEGQQVVATGQVLPPGEVQAIPDVTLRIPNVR